MTHTPDGKQICYRYNMKGKSATACATGSMFVDSRVASRTIRHSITSGGAWQLNSTAEHQVHQFLNSLRVIYVFAGHRRRADIREHLGNLAQEFHHSLNVHEFDLLRGKDKDVLDSEFWTFLADLVTSNPPFCIIVTAVLNLQQGKAFFHQQSPGSRPIGSRQFPRVFLG